MTTIKSRLRRAAAEVAAARGIRELVHLSSPAWRILTYHRVVNPEETSYPLQPGMYVRPEHFAMQMEILSREWNVVALDELLLLLRDRKSAPERAVALTFDDGWADWHRNVLPVLTRFSLPATFFLATSFIGGSEFFWTDKAALAVNRLIRAKEKAALLDALRAPETLDAGMQADIARLLQAKGRTDEEAEVDVIIEKLKSLPPDERSRALEKLLALSSEAGAAPPERVFLSWDEVQEMAESGCRFGSHSHRHRSFAELNETELADEIENSLQTLQSKGLSPSPVFCYPGGYYNERSQQVLAEKGIRFAVTTERTSDTDCRPALFGRIGIHDDISCTPALFSLRIQGSRLF